MEEMKQRFRKQPDGQKITVSARAVAMETPKKGAPERDIEKKGQAMGNARDTGPERRSCP